MEIYEWLLAYGYRAETVSREIARERVLVVGPSNPLYPFVPHFRRERPHLTEISLFHPDVMSDVNHRLECRNTIAGLAGSGIECPSINQAIVHRCLDFLVNANCLLAPTRA
jgi:hypothetical protein